MSALLLQGCGVPQSPEEFHKTAEARSLQAALDRLAAQDYAAITASFDQRVAQDGMQEGLQQMHALLPKEAPVGKKPAQWNFRNTIQVAGEGKSGRIAEVAIEYEYPSSRWIFASATFSGEPADLRMISFHVQPLSASLADINAFTLHDKSLVHYLFLLMGLGSIGLALFAFVVCIRTKGLKRKWLWAICTLMTVSTFTLNWTSGESGFQPLFVHLLGWSALRTGWIGPWIITVPLPLGAVIFLWKHGRRKPVDAVAVAA